MEGKTWKSDLSESVDIQDNASAGPCSANELAAHYQKAYRKLTCIASGVLGHFKDAEDIVQQAVSIAIDKKEVFNSGEHFVGWLCSTVRLCAMNQRRKSKGRKTSPADPRIFSTMLDDRSSSQDRLPLKPGTGLLDPNQHAFDDQMLQALESIGHEPRCCLLLRVVENLSYKEISEIMNIPEGTAMSHVHRGKTRLRETLSADRQIKGGGV